MLLGTQTLLRMRRVGLVFLSTHSVELHEKCRQFLSSISYLQLVSVNLPDSYSADGVLVFHSPDVIAPAVTHPVLKRDARAR